MGGMGGMAAALTVLVQARGVGMVNKQLAGVQGQMTATGAKAGGMGALIRKGILVGIAAVASIGVALFKLGEKFDDAYDTIRVGTGATGKTLEGLKGDFREVVKSVPTDFKTASTAIADLNTRLGLTGKPLQDRAKQFLELSRITGTDVKGNIEAVTKAFNDWAVPVERQGRTLDGFFRLSQATGISVQELTRQVQESGSPLRQLGFSLDEAAAMLAGFDKAGVNTSKMTSGFQQAITNLTRPTGTLKDSMKELGIAAGDPKKGLEEVMKVMTDKTIPATVRTGLAMDVFGRRAGADVAEAIEQGRFAVGDLMDTMRNGSDTIMKAGADTMDFSEKWQMFKNRVLVALEPVAMRVFDGMGKLMDVLPPIAARVFSAVSTLLTPLTALGGVVTRNKTAMTALGVVVGTLVTVWAGYKVAALAGALATKVSTAAANRGTAAWVVKRAALLAAAGAVKAYTAVQWALNLAMRANPIGLVITALVALAAGFVWAYKKIGGFRKVVQAVFGWVKSNWPKIAAIMTGPVGIAVLAIVRNWSKLKAATSSAWNAIKGLVGGAAGRARDLAVRAFDGIKGGVSRTFERVKAMVKGAFDTIWGFLRSLPARFYQAGRSLIIALANGIKAVAMAPVNAVKGVINRVRNLLPGSEPKDPTSPLRGLGGMGAAIMENMAAGVPAGARALTSAMANNLPVPVAPAGGGAMAVGGGGGVDQSRAVTFVHHGDVIYSDSSDEDRVVRKHLWQLRVAGLA